MMAIIRKITKAHFILFVALCCIFVLLGANRLAAAPVTYLYDDTTGGGYAGTGMFTLDIGSALGTYNATGVSGGPGSSIGIWVSVEFDAVQGFIPELFFRDSVPSSFGLIFNAIGGGNVLPGSQANLEWANFITQAAPFGIIITPQTAPSVPEPATMLLLGSGLIGLAGYGRKKFFRQ